MAKAQFGDYIRARRFAHTQRKNKVDHSGITYAKAQDDHTPSQCNDDGRNGTCTKCLAVFTRLHG